MRRRPPAAKQDSPVRQVFLRQKLRVILSIGALAISTAINYSSSTCRPTRQNAELSPIVGFTATFAAGIMLTFLTPIAGHDFRQVGRTTHMIAVNLLLLFSIYPAFLLLTRNPTPAVIVVAVLWLATLKSLYYGPLLH